MTGDAHWVWASLALVAVAAVVGPLLERAGSQLFVNAAPLIGDRKPHLGIGSPVAIALAVAAVAVFPRMVRRTRWRPLLLISWLAAVCWTVSLALIDGWQRGWVDRLSNSNEYLHDLPRIDGIGGFLSAFASHIKDFQPGSWTTHVAGHPPAATLVFLLLDRIGLGGGAWAGVVVVAIGTLAAVAVPVTLRVLGAPRAARAVLPFTVFFPGAVWVGVSADGLFAGVAATGLAVTLIGVLSRRRFAGVVAAVCGGILLGLTAYLSYGLVLLIVVIGAASACSAAVLATRGRWLRGWLVGWSSAAVGVLAVIALFSVAGFSWFQGLAELQVRYYQGIASLRPYGYFVWANLAALVLSAGPVVAAGLARAVTVLRHPAGGRLAGGRLRVQQLGSWWGGAEMLVPATISVAALVAVLTADLSGLSKAETERIWLPFGFYLLSGLALLPRRARRWAVAVQVGCALVVNHLVLTQW
ncbi:MAG: hypothetical protein M3Z00_11215 [Actinomycetota bacterium]|nr:hypothetical protein [Actinomycetota bacterium]